MQVDLLRSPVLLELGLDHLRQPQRPFDLSRLGTLGALPGPQVRQHRLVSVDPFPHVAAQLPESIMGEVLRPLSVVLVSRWGRRQVRGPEREAKGARSRSWASSTDGAWHTAERWGEPL
ncbi:MAG: hypothetical protein QG597_377 [Actinomycetota bacterium]|nr:hypothetical protein [Actinomycetota bacterium]